MTPSKKSEEGGSHEATGGIQTSPQAGGIQMTMRGAHASFAPAPTKNELEARGALFMALPDESYDDLLALCTARKAGLLDDQRAEQLSQVVREISALVARSLVSR